MRNIFESMSKSGEYIFSTTLGIKPLNCFSKIKKRPIISRNNFNKPYSIDYDAFPVLKKSN
tara:strand:+ start:296 stop:478 length:183 start_codon:yes stop_codon:yes gene_type:complete